MRVILEQVATVAAMLLALVALAWLTAYAVSATERRLIGGLGLILGGLFLATRAADPSMVGVALALCGAGVVVLVRAVLAWRERGASPLWPVAAAVLIPCAFVGALLLGGLLYSVLAGPARLATRLTLG